MEKKFHLFVRRHPGLGVTVSALGVPELTAFAEDVDDARAQLVTVAQRLLSHNLGGLADREHWWPRLKLRRLELVLRARQHRRLLPVPMRFTVLTHPLREDGSAKGREQDGPLAIHIPRLELQDTLDGQTDFEAHVEELIRHRLYRVPLEELLAAAYDGEESIETLAVAYRPQAARIAGRADTHERRTLRPPAPPALAEASRRLSDARELGTLERAFQRERELDALLEVVSAGRRGGVLLVGPHGVGKTALVHELAHRAAEAAEGSSLRGLEVYTSSGSRIVAGMTYLGEWQQRMQEMIDELRSHRSALHLESLSELLNTFGGESGMDAAQYLLPAMETGDVCVLVETTEEDLARAERTHAPFLRALKPLRVAPLSLVAARTALSQVAQRIGRERGVRFADGALDVALELTERFGESDALPGAAVQLLRAAALHASSAGPKDKSARPVGEAELTRAFAERTGFPRELVDRRAPLDPEEVLSKLRSRVVGQEQAMVLLRDLVVTLKTSMSDPRKPLGSFLLLGPTGVGKTESALALAEYLFGDSKRLARFDMSEYAAPGSALRLVSSWGGTEGSLARRVREQPFGIVLFDEIEKADPGVHDLLLQILGEGRLTDGTGRTVSFRNTVVMLTSNLGADTASRSLGFSDGRPRDLGAHYLAAAAAFFRPELLNRLDQVVPYHALSQEVVHELVRRHLTAALSREGLTRRSIEVRFGEAEVSLLAAAGFDPRYGARPLKRALEQRVVAPLAALLSARTSDTLKTLHLSARGSALLVSEESFRDAPPLDQATTRDALESSGLRAQEVTLSVSLRDLRTRRLALWLLERLADSTRALGLEPEVTAEEAGTELRLRVRGVGAELLRLEAGVHRFEEGTEGAVEVLLLAGQERRLEHQRLYLRAGLEAVFDRRLHWEHRGSWEEALSPSRLQQRWSALRAP